MAWTRKLTAPIILKDGRTIATVGGARAVMLSLPERLRRNEHWLYAVELLLEAATARGPLKKATTQYKATTQLTLALEAEGLI
jgi:hypothetical protein